MKRLLLKTNGKKSFKNTHFLKQIMIKQKKFVTKTIKIEKLSNIENDLKDKKDLSQEDKNFLEGLSLDFTTEENIREKRITIKKERGEFFLILKQIKINLLLSLKTIMNCVSFIKK